jgi:hypothetical protein
VLIDPCWCWVRIFQNRPLDGRVAWKELALLGFTGTLSARRAKNNECNLISRSTSSAQAASARHRNISCAIAKGRRPTALSRAGSRFARARSAKLIGIDPKSLSDDTGLCPYSKEASRRRRAKCPAKNMSEVRLVRKAGCVRRRREIAPVRNFENGHAEASPPAIAAKGNPDLLRKQVLEPRGRETHRAGNLCHRHEIVVVPLHIFDGERNPRIEFSGGSLLGKRHQILQRLAGPLAAGAIFVKFTHHRNFASASDERARHLARIVYKWSEGLPRSDVRFDVQDREGITSDIELGPLRLK